MSLAFAFQIDSVSFDLNDRKLTVSGPQGEILNHEFIDSLLEYEYVVDTPYFELGGSDGVVELAESKGLRSFPRRDLAVDSFPKFSFFSQEKDTIGLLFGSAGATGSDSQDVYFINTQTGVFIKLHIANMEKATWIIQDRRILGFKDYDADFSFGSHAVSWGKKARISHVTFFDNEGKLTLDQKALNDFWESEYKKVTFSAEEKKSLQEDIMSRMEYRLLGEKLVDFVYYGFKLGKQKEVYDFLNTLNPVYSQEAKFCE